MGKDTFYFSHDYNARNDEKIKELISNKEIRLNGERKNKRGKASNLYKKV
jgi:hypothetical protein